MATFRETNRITINAFPDYECILLWSPQPLIQEMVSAGKVAFRYYHESDWRDRQLSKPFAILPDILEHLANITGCFSVNETDGLLVHPKCKIPRKLISKGKVISSKSVDFPDKIVVPNDYEYYISRQTNSYNCVFMVNEEAKIVFAIVRTLLEREKLGGTEAQWKAALQASYKLFPDFGPLFNGFTMPLGIKQYCIVNGLEEIDEMLLSGMFPKDRVISEAEVPTGKDEPTVDMLYSVYNMLKSPDEQIKLTAVNMLAQSYFYNVKHLVGWILRNHHKFVLSCRSRSTSIAWLYDNCVVSKHETLQLPSYYEKSVAQKLITRISNDAILWDPNGKAIYGLSADMSDPKFRELVGKASMS